MVEYTVTVQPALSIISGMHGIGAPARAPVFAFKSLVSGLVTVNAITAYASENDCEIIMVRNPTMGTTFQQHTVISGLVPNDTRTPVAISGFIALAWNGVAAVNAVRGISGFLADGDVVYASIAHADGHPAKHHFHNGFRIFAGDRFALYARTPDFNQAKIFIDVELNYDASGVQAVLETNSTQAIENPPPV